MCSHNDSSERSKRKFCNLKELFPPGDTYNSEAQNAADQEIAESKFET